ncbi:MAG TPA: hypothetical protein VL335_03170 [Candidatus Paceibacterota bacterium]|jgi:hypothetical protein|nr:hypothetical protein [Candidatus Paceibacterota bacterium]
MKLTRTSVLAASSLLIGGFMGASALVALAGWTNAPANPPSSNTEAPINVGSILQSKTGWLGVNGLITNNLYVASGTVSTGGSVLTNDGAGNAKWAAPGASQECGSDGYMYAVSNSVLDDWDTVGSGDALQYFCRNHVIRLCLSSDNGSGTCPWRTNIAGDDTSTCSVTSLKTGTNGIGYWQSAPPSLCNGQAPCTTSSNFNTAGTVMAAQKYANTWYMCTGGKHGQKTIIKQG